MQVVLYVFNFLLSYKCGSVSRFKTSHTNTPLFKHKTTISAEFTHDLLHFNPVGAVRLVDDVTESQVELIWGGRRHARFLGIHASHCEAEKAARVISSRTRTSRQSTRCFTCSRRWVLTAYTPKYPCKFWLYNLVFKTLLTLARTSELTSLPRVESRWGVKDFII